MSYRCLAVTVRVQELNVIGLHPQDSARGGVCAAERRTAACAVVVSGGYEDNLDRGDEIWYSGQGGHSGTTCPFTSRQDQQVTKANLSADPCSEDKEPCEGHPHAQELHHARDRVHVRRAVPRDRTPCAHVGVSGHWIFHFHLVRDPGQAPYRCPLTATPSFASSSGRAAATSRRLRLRSPSELQTRTWWTSLPRLRRRRGSRGHHEWV